jgi:hypothetical protein
MKKVKESLIFLPCIYFKDNLILILIKNSIIKVIILNLLSSKYKKYYL